MKHLEAVYVENSKIVYGYLISLTQDQDLAEELTQETFYQASKTLHQFKGDCKLSVWLCQIAKFLWYKQLKKQKKIETLSMDDISELEVGYQDVNKEIWHQFEKVELFRQIHLLDAMSKEVVYLRLSGDLSFAQIGDILNKSETWARVTFYRAKKQLLEGRTND
ncbi:MAG: sigma-70 family RNA polymerase sigma factor [Turicibacter sp.]|nr:sigma-70 family RNA polymerase sigma factor [Turicibacter sp.]